MEEKIINEAIEMTKGVPWKDVLVPLSQEEKEICPYPHVNTHLANGRVCDGGVQISGWPIARFYQSMERRNVDCGPEPEMPSENSKAGGQGPEPLHMPGLENEPDLYEDVEEDADE